MLKSCIQLMQASSGHGKHLYPVFLRFCHSEKRTSPAESLKSCRYCFAQINKYSETHPIRDQGTTHAN